MNKDFQPTRLYIKECVDVKYFGKSTKEDIESYNGSGVIWLKRIKKYGKENVKTLWVSDWYTDKNELEKFALEFSEKNNIVESTEWANLIPENGLDGHSSEGAKLVNGRLETRKKISERTTGKNNPRYDPTIYSFTNSDGVTVNVTKFEFRKICPLISTGELAKIIKGKHKSAYGWRLSSTPIENTGQASSGRKSSDTKIYEFCHSSGKIEKCTRKHLTETYNLNPTHVSSIINGKAKYPHKGWSIKNNMNKKSL